MLVLSRKLREQIRIGNDILITVMRIGPNCIRLGVDAPAEVNIARGELLPLKSDLSGQQGSDPGLAHILEDRKSA